MLELTSLSDDNGLKVTRFETDQPVRAMNLMAGTWDSRSLNGATVFYHPAHERNVNEMLTTLVAARERYSEWFHPYPWDELRLSEFPNLFTNARSYPTNISFSESAGFLNQSRSGASGPFSVVAHEAAHQWWPHLLIPGEAPGADVLIEGMAQYAALLLHESENGVRARIQFALASESSYITERKFDGEKPLFEIVSDGRRSVESTIYHKGMWAIWMLHNELGRSAMLKGLSTFIDENLVTDDYPTLQDLCETLRPFAADSASYQNFVDQWFDGVVLPEYRFLDVQIDSTKSQWNVLAVVENIGTGTASVTVSAERGERFTGQDMTENPDFEDSRLIIRLGPGESRSISFELSFGLSFEPERIVVDPDALVLQFNRDVATKDL